MAALPAGEWLFKIILEARKRKSSNNGLMSDEPGIEHNIHVEDEHTFNSKILSCTFIPEQQRHLRPPSGRTHSLPDAYFLSTFSTWHSSGGQQGGDGWEGQGTGYKDRQVQLPSFKSWQQRERSYTSTQGIATPRTPQGRSFGWITCFTLGVGGVQTKGLKTLKICR